MRAFLLLTMVLMILGLSGCETMEGLGKDVKSLGESIEKKASDSSD
ncbi:MAG TPA: entericidin A/B family lipoprotein [Gammaproteobacteria bacterium]|nr:entericidin A/B family lipoprotein [Gammaproteobacteria bacterium]